MSGDIQKARVLNLLYEHRNNWVSSVNLSHISLQYNSRIFSLRRDGWDIRSWVRRVRPGVKFGYYCLVIDQQTAAMLDTPEIVALNDDSPPKLFDDIPTIETTDKKCCTRSGAHA
jgi:hypothetical protein